MVSAALGASDQGVWGVYTLAVRQLWCGRGEVTTLKVEEEVMYFTQTHNYIQMAVYSSTSSIQFCSYTMYAVHRHTCTVWS
jgi:hypothetical protein